MATTASMPAYLLPGVPVVQPPHLEGDATLATEILPGPPSPATVQQLALKRDPKKPSMAYSYLPPSDPGSTYSGIMHGTLIGLDPEGARSKRAKDKGASGRAQRASARQQGSNAAPAPELPTTLAPTVLPAAQSSAADSDNTAMMVDEDIALSRSASSVNLQLQDPPQPPAATKTKRKDKGKGKEVEDLPPRVKEEPKALSLQTPEPVGNLLNNEDHCSSCRFSGELVYCDGCPKAFHLWCLDPPLESVDDARWFCPTCMSRKHPPRKPPPSLFSAVIHHVQVMHPLEYQLPEEIRTFFKDVGTGPKGTYVDTSELKPPRLNRHGQLEDRDPYRLRDRNGGSVLCYQCGHSALPSTLSSSTPASKRPRRSKAASPDAWKSLVSCDYCNLHWHLDCLDPPLPTLPPLNKKWMCPNHAEKALPPKRRIPRQHAPPIEITKPRQFNNGNIDVIHPQYTSAFTAQSVPVDEVLINGRRYRVPEKIIVLDFWNKLNKVDEHSQRDEVASNLSSPLTELSSLDEDDVSSSSSQSVEMVNGDFDEHAAAQVLFGLCTKGTSPNALGLHNVSKKLVDRSVQTECDPPTPGVPSKNKVGRPRKHPEPNVSLGRTTSNMTSEFATTSSNVTVSTIRRKRVSSQVVPKPSSRALRSRSRNANVDPSNGASSRDSNPRGDESVNDKDISLGSISVTALTKPKAINVKVEEVETPLNQPLLSDAPDASGVDLSKTRIIRAPRQPVSRQKVAPKDTKEKRGRKRKTREDELPGDDGENGIDMKDPHDPAKSSGKADESEKLEREPKKLARTPSRLTLSNSDLTPLSSSVPLKSPSTQVTPSLKIRLPRLHSINNAGSSSAANLDSPTKRTISS